MMHPRTLLLALAVLGGTAFAQEATIRKNLTQRLPSLPAIDSVTPTPMKGLFEVRINGTELMYSDANGDFVLLQGELFDTRQRVNLTEARINQLTAIAFKDLPLKDAVVTVRGNGSRKIAVFSDPNCGFCKRLERDLLKINNVTVYTFVVAMLGPDSQTKARNIWCAAKPAEAYNDWMLDGQTPPTQNCDSAALTRNLAFAQKHRINGTPTSFLADGTRIAGADMKAIERGLAAQK
jgi:thiol:disulfide interchange protein DsbC